MCCRNSELFSLLQVKVYIQLYREGDQFNVCATSEPIEFQYQPCHETVDNRKRPRISPSTSNSDDSAMKENAQYQQQFNHDHLQQNGEKSGTLEQLYEDIPEIRNVKYNPRGNDPSRLVAQMLRERIF